MSRPTLPRTRRWALCLLLLGALPAGAATPAEQAQTLLEALHDVSGVPGLGAAVWAGGHMAWAGSAGQRDLENGLPVQADTRFRLASVSKVFVATAAARLRQEGRLDADQPIADLLPWLQRDWPAISSRQLAAHLSGLPHYEARDSAIGQQAFPSSRHAVQAHLQRPLVAAPGERYLYSSWGYTLLAAVVEERAGATLPELLRQVLAPGLDIGTDVTDTAHPQASRAYQSRSGRWQRAPRHDFSYSLGGAGLSATAPALARWGAAVLQGEIVSAATRAWMFEPTQGPGGRPVQQGSATLAFGWRLGRGNDGEPVVHHSGLAPGARSTLVLWPEQGAAASLLSNAEWVSSIEGTARVLAAPFLPFLPAAPAAADLAAPACPAGSGAWQGQLARQPVSGQWQRRPGRAGCEIELRVDEALPFFDNRTPTADARRMRIVAFGAGLGRAALVTPIGLYDLRAVAGGALRADVAGREFVLQLNGG